MINTDNTRHFVKKKGDHLWFFNNWQDFLANAGLTEFNHFMKLSGVQVDRNRATVVYRVVLGDKKQVFYIKIHKNYFKRNIKSLFKKEPYSRIELRNLMHYARADLDVLEPVAWGWRSGVNGEENFLLIQELNDYVSLQEWLKGTEGLSFERRQNVALAVIKMLSKMHNNGLAHVDLFSWHIFIKNDGKKCHAHPIDLERTKKKGFFPGSDWLIRRKQANDLAALHLTIPWPLVSFSERMRYFKEYCRLRGINDQDRSFLNLVLSIARHRGRKKKFKPFGVANKFITG